MNEHLTQIILIMTDQQRKDLVSAYGIKEMQTPNIDRLAEGGMRFDAAYCCSPVCTPARSALFTGLFPHSNGCLANEVPLGDTCLTLGQRLQAAGIQTGYIGKWHLDASDYFGTGQCPDGWDPAYWYDMRNYLDELTPEERRRSRVQGAHDKIGDIEPEFTFAHRCVNRALRFIEEHKEQSYFLVVSFDEPHHPCLCPKEYVDKFRNYEFPKSLNIWDTLEDKPAMQKRWAGDRVHEDKDSKTIIWPDYFGVNHYIDTEIGRIVDAIDEHAEDAMVVYTADHGDMNNSHSLHSKGPAMYEEITSIPFIVRWPNRVMAGVACGDPVSHISVVPTILDAFGLEQPSCLDGAPITTTLTAQEKPKQPIFMEFNRHSITQSGGRDRDFFPIRSCRSSRYKLAVNLLDMDELYDMENDPAEIVNLIYEEEHSDARNALHDELIEWMDETLDPMRGDSWRLRPWRNDLEQLHVVRATPARRHDGHPQDLRYSTGMPAND